MKKGLLVLLLSVFLFLLAACHHKIFRVGFAVPEAFDETKPYEITFWAKNDTNNTQIAVYRKAAEDFEKLYPNIHVTIKFYTDYNIIYNDVITNITTGTTPNVCITYPDHIATYLTGDKIVVPLDELLADSRYGLGGSELRFDGPGRGEIIDRFLGELKIGGIQYGLPYMRSTEALYVNKTMLDAMGYELPDVLTWDYVFEVSEAAMEKEADGKTFKVNGQRTMVPFVYKSTDNMMIQMLKQKGGEYSTDRGEILVFNDTTKEILYQISEHAKSRAFDTFSNVSYPGDLLNAGQCLFAVDSTAGATWMGSDAPLMDIDRSQVVPFETAVRPVPQYDPEHPQMISQGPSVCLFNKEDPQEVLASWLFAQFLLTNSVQIGYAKTEGYVPVTSKAQQSAEYRDYLSKAGTDTDEHYDVKIRASELLLANTENTFVTPVFNGSTSLRNAAGDLIEYCVLYVRRQKKMIDDDYLEGELWGKITSLRRLDQIETPESPEKPELGELPKTSVFLLAGLGAAWVLIGTAVLIRQIRKKKHGGG